jgi:hypothetical protein
VNSQISIKVAMKKGLLHLMYIPMFFFFLFPLLGVLIDRLEQGNSGYYFGIGVVVGLATGMLYWSKNAVKWKLWAFPKVGDPRGLENRAIAKKIIYRRNSLFSKLEWPSKTERAEMEALYREIEDKLIIREAVDDRTLPHELVVTHKKHAMYLTSALAMVGILASASGLKPSIILIGLGLFGFIYEYRKWKNNPTNLIANGKGLTLNNEFYSWDNIVDHHVRPVSIISEDFILEIELKDQKIAFALDNLSVNAFDLEKKLDGYRYRFEKNNGNDGKPVD